MAAALALVFLLGLTGCGGERRPSAPEVYVVQKGDTLYSIGWRYGLDYSQLARWNGIGRDYRIEVGQRLRLRPPPLAPGQRPEWSELLSCIPVRWC